jgi:archaellum component FlaC
MTFVGKILVVIILLMSCIFMAWSVMVQTARLDLKADLAKAKQDVGKLETAKNDLTSERDKLETDLKANQEKLKQEMDLAKKEIDKRQAQIDQLQAQLAQQTKDFGSAITQTGIAQEQQTERTREVTDLRAKNHELIKKNMALSTQRLELTDQLTQANNDLESLRARNQQLEERYKELSQYVMRRTGGFPDEVELRKYVEGGPPPPPDVRGIVTATDQTGRYVELSIGEDDGIRKGQELEVWRTKPEPKYIGKIQIVTTYPTKSVAKPIAVSKLIQKDDEVGPRIFVNR